MARLARAALGLAWACVIALEPTMCIPAVTTLVSPEAARGIARATGGPTMQLAAAITAVTCSIAAWLLDRRRAAMLQRLEVERACWDCGHPQEPAHGPCPECGTQSTSRVRVVAHSRWTSARHMLTVGLFAAMTALTLAVAVDTSLPALAMVGPLFPPLLLGLLTVKHLAVRSREETVS